ncbi:hypothetical protein [Bifidobacterium mongoliense]|uniref:hypothetical protein n=1 Tax=Bifidobacterium mongoliense TaxID=518643 RepID=UPI0030EEC3D6
MPLSAKKLPLLQQAEAILKDSGVDNDLQSRRKAIRSSPFPRSESIVKDGTSTEKTVKQIAEAKINRSDYRYVIPTFIILVVLGAIYYFAAKNLSVDWNKDSWKTVMLVIAAIVTVVSSMYEIRVKRVDEVIAEYKEAYPEAAAIMNRDPWVMANRSWAIIVKYVSIVTVFMAALLAIN